MATGSPAERLARAVKRGGSSPAWLPRAPRMSLHQGTVNSVDTFKGTIDFQFPDPSGLVVPEVRYVLPYSTTNPPTVGDVVWTMHFGTDLMVLGQHFVPNNIVSF